MALNDLLRNRFARIMSTLAALAVPAGLGCEADEGSPVYPAGSQSTSQPTSQPCYSDSECKGERICVSGYCQDSTANNINWNSNGSNSYQNIYGVWRDVNAVPNPFPFPLVLFEKCNEGQDNYLVLEGIQPDGTCNYGDGGKMSIANSQLTLFMASCPDGIKTVNSDVYNFQFSGSNLKLIDITSNKESVLEKYSGSIAPCESQCKLVEMFGEPDPCSHQ
ncbi:MAG TPA: hypothetical protein VJA23_02780 [Candidatus Nanoarchaeia archaeon]|nr:hypothetical protein [Candidatus Nanoarchaeia archaeon]